MAAPGRVVLDPFFGAFLGWDRAAAKKTPQKRVILRGQNLRTPLSNIPNLPSKNTSCSEIEREGRLVSVLGSGEGSSSHHCWEVELRVFSSHGKLEFGFGFFLTALELQSSRSGVGLGVTQRGCCHLLKSGFLALGFLDWAPLSHSLKILQHRYGVHQIKQLFVLPNYFQELKTAL